jgi:OHCU decarboxylase
MPELERPAQVSIAELDAMREAQAAELLKACCGSTKWVTAMLTRRPFQTRDVLLAAADIFWQSLSPADWIEAFSQHPRIGAREVPAREAEEQSGMQSANANTRAELAQANRQYEQRFGYVYIVCATGRTAEEMLAMARVRLANTPEAELATAAREQQKITRLRLERLFP